jgi:hypothetical protein
MYLSLEEYIAKRKRKDGLNEFSAENRIKNMGKCITYVIEYFEKYLDPQKMDFEEATREAKASKLRKQLAEYDPEIVEWIIGIYKNYGTRVDRILKNYLKQNLLIQLGYGEEEFVRYAEEFIESYAKSKPYLRDQKEMVVRLLKAIVKLRAGQFTDFGNHYRLEAEMVKWLSETYKNYSVNLLQFASDYADKFFDLHHEYRYNSALERVETIRDYDHRAEESNLFNIDSLYDSVKDKPFMSNRKVELEMLIMYVWLEQITGDTEYWNEYLNKAKQRLEHS